MVYVRFSRGAISSAEWAELTCGPYRAIDIVEGKMVVMDGFHPFTLAIQDGQGWRVNDGMGTDGPLWKTANIISRGTYERVKKKAP